jgi:hypothetical protein
VVTPLLRMGDYEDVPAALRLLHCVRTLTRIGLAVGDDTLDRYTGVPEARLLLGKTLAKKNCLIILDDVWEVGVAEALHTAAGKSVRILLTSRKRKLFASAGVHEVPVDELSKEEAVSRCIDVQAPRASLRNMKVYCPSLTSMIRSAPRASA